jgi:rhodanese-related sulfurtransferase/DNA-binding transcriptional ArsR family regulator
MTGKSFKTSVFEQLAKVGKAFSNHNRIELLELLAQGERTVDSLAKLAGLSVANTSQHLQLLRNSGLVRSVKIGQYVHYQLNDDTVIDILMSLRKISKHQIQSIENMLEAEEPSHSQQKTVVVKDLVMAKIANNTNDFVVVDVRPKNEYEHGHIENAISIPFDEIDKYIASLPKDKEIIAYCRGPYSLLARKSVAKLTDEGFKAARLSEGYTGWRQTSKCQELIKQQLH